MHLSKKNYIYIYRLYLLTIFVKDSDSSRLDRWVKTEVITQEMFQSPIFIGATITPPNME